MPLSATSAPVRVSTYSPVASAPEGIYPRGMDSPPIETPRLAHLPSLDGVRALAIGAVLWTHLWTYPETTPILNRLAAAGWIGVDLFFALSGFLITRVLLAAKDRPDYYRHFYARRVRRIMPAYYLLLAVVLLALPIVSQSADLAAVRHDWLWYVTYLSNVRLAQLGWQLFLLDITWSLAVEEQFYAVWPWIVRHVTRDGLVRVALALVIALPLIRAVCLWTGLVSPRWMDLLTPFRMDSLAIGALLAARELRLPAFTRWRAIALGSTLAGVVALIVLGHFGRESGVVTVAGHSMLALVSALTLHAAIHGSGSLARLLATPLLGGIGRVSYGMYLYHPLVLALTGTALAHVGVSIATSSAYPIINGVVQWGLVSLVTVGVAWCSHRYYESPLLRWRAVRSDRRPRSVPAT